MRKRKRVIVSVLTRLETSYEGIAGKTLIASANRAMVDHFASRINATDTGTWIDTFTIFACAIYGTIRADSAFRATTWWSSDKCG